jgi:cystathionine gamma-lyase
MEQTLEKKSTTDTASTQKNMYQFGTRAIHAGQEPDPSTGAIMTPIYQTSTYVQESPGKHKGYAYARGKNPTRVALEKCIASLENAKYGICFSSGQGAEDAVIKLLRPGDEVVATDDIYGGSYRMFTKIYEHFGIKFRFVDMTDATALEKNITDKTKMLWLETPTNPIMRILDIEAISKIARKIKYFGLCRQHIRNSISSKST